MLTPSEKRCVTSVLEDRVRLLRDPEARGELGISDVLNDTVGEMADDVLTAAGAGDYAPDGREHVFLLESFILDVEDYGDWDPWARCDYVGFLKTIDDAELAEFLVELSRASGQAVSVAAALDAVNRHRGALGLAPLDPAGAGWTTRDVLDEAARIARLPNAAADLLP